jgi:hypothetical protein
MKKLQLSSMLLLLSIMLGLLAACGGDTPTATAVPPPATNTSAPPTNTTLPPSPTTAAPTATIAAVTAATATPEAMIPAPTEPPTGGGLATPTAGVSGGTIATPAGTPVSSAEEILIEQALTATKELKSYHFTMSATGDVFTQPVQIEGDYVAPDKAYIKGTMGGQQVEEVVSAGKVYDKVNGQWVPQAQPTPGAEGINPVDLTSSANPLESLSSLTGAGTQYHDVGQETIDGVQTRHFVGEIGTASMMGGSGDTSGMPDLQIGSVNLWIDPSTKYIHKMTLNVDLAALLNLMSAAFSQLAGTPEPGTPTATPLPTSLKMDIQITVSKPNDPSISVPNPTQ